MSGGLLYSIIETPAHPDFSRLYRQLGMEQLRVVSMRKAIAELKRRPPEWVVAEFLYGYGNNYAGVNVSNLDVFLHSLRKYAPEARVVVMVQPKEREFVAKLQALFSLHAVLLQPVSEAQLASVLNGD